MKKILFFSLVLLISNISPAQKKRRDSSPSPTIYSLDNELIRLYNKGSALIAKQIVAVRSVNYILSSGINVKSFYEEAEKMTDSLMSVSEKYGSESFYLYLDSILPLEQISKKSSPKLDPEFTPAYIKEYTLYWKLKDEIYHENILQEVLYDYWQKILDGTYNIYHKK